MKNVKNLDLKMLWSDNINNDNIKPVNNMNDNDDIKDLGLKVFWFEKILIRLRRLRMFQTKELIIKSKSESDEKERWLDLKFKTLLLSCALDSAFNNILIITLNNRKLNDSKFDNAIAIWCFFIINLASVVMIIMLLWLHIVARFLLFMTRYC